MPRFPAVASSIASIRGSVYAAWTRAQPSGETYPLHVGDTWLEPAVGSRMQDLTVHDHPGMHRYAEPRGMMPLLDAIAARCTQRMGVQTRAENVLVTAGATGGLGAAVGAIVEPGDEVLILAPFWPLIRGIVRCFHATPVEVPFIGEVDSADAAIACVSRFLTPKTAALYISTPNNPTGRVIPPEWIEALVAWAGRKRLWILADEVYEDYVYEGKHAYCRTLAPDRTFSAHSFSKAFGMAGNRCGYVVGPDDVMPELCKVSTHSFYSTPTASQIAEHRALQGIGDAWIADVRPRYLEMGERAAERLGVPPPQGSTFLFLDVAAHLDADGLSGFLKRCAAQGLFLAPGPSFGPYPTHVRVCFTSAPPERVAKGVDILAGHIGR